MTEFNPEFALEVLERRQADVNREAYRILSEKYRLAWDGKIPHFGSVADAMDKQVHQLWAKADSYNGTIEYLRKRIWDSKTFAEKTWELIKDWDFKFGPELIEDVIEAQRNVALGWRA